MTCMMGHTDGAGACETNAQMSAYSENLASPYQEHH